MKKSIAMFLTALANIILLAHIVVPHHTTSQHIDYCKSSIHKISNNTDQCPHTDNHGILQNGEKSNSNHLSIENCQLEDIHIRLNKDNNTLHQDNINVDITYLSKLIIRILNPQIILKEAILTEYIAPIYNFIPTSAISLRAPPY